MSINMNINWVSLAKQNMLLLDNQKWDELKQRILQTVDKLRLFKVNFKPLFY